MQFTKRANVCIKLLRLAALAGKQETDDLPLWIFFSIVSVAYFTGIVLLLSVKSFSRTASARMVSRIKKGLAD